MVMGGTGGPSVTPVNRVGFPDGVSYDVSHLLLSHPHLDLCETLLAVVFSPTCVCCPPQKDAIKRIVQRVMLNSSVVCREKNRQQYCDDDSTDYEFCASSRAGASHVRYFSRSMISS